MITVNLTKDANGIIEVRVKGHSGYAPHGKDIVCSAVSAVVQTALLGIIDASESEVLYEIDEKTGYLKFAVPKAASERENIKQQAILRAMEIGLLDIEKGYKTFVKLEDN